MFLQGKTYTFNNGIYLFIDEEAVTGDNQKYQKLYDRIAWIYNLSQRFFFWLKFSGKQKFREPFLRELTIKDTDKVLEISTGTGDNFLFLNKQADYVGVDISMGMLRQAKKHIKRWKIATAVVICEAVFPSVVHK